MFRGYVSLTEINFLANYRAGLASGVVWSKVRGGGWLVGHADGRGELTGDNIAFMYPDFSTAILGRFDKGILVRGKAARITGLSFIDGVLWPQFRVLSDRCHSM